MKQVRFLNLLLLASATMLAVSCKKSYLDTKPSDAITLEQAYASISAVNSAIASGYLQTFAFGGGNGQGGHDNYGQKSFESIWRKYQNIRLDE